MSSAIIFFSRMAIFHPVKISFCLLTNTLKLSTYMILQSAGNTRKTDGEIQNGNEATDKGKISITGMFSKLPVIVKQFQIILMFIYLCLMLN